MATRKHNRADAPTVVEEGLRAKGMYRIQIEESGEIVGDSGWKENVVTNLGFNLYLVSGLGKIAGSGQIGYLALGTGTYPASADTTLSGEISQGTARQAVTSATSSTSKTVHFTGTFNSTNSFLGASSNIANIGLFNTASTFGTLFSGNTYASRAVATNQNVNCSYDITFS